MKRKKVLKKINIKGAFLIELLIAISIMSTLSVGSYLMIRPQIIRAHDAKIKMELNSIKTAFQEYFDDHFCFPTSLPNCGSEFKINNNTYFNKFPCGRNDKPFVYEVENNACPQWYRISANLENTKDQSIDDVHCRNGCGPNCLYNYAISENISTNQGCIIFYACSPNGTCIDYTDPSLSQCPKVYENDGTCMNECSKNDNRCKNEKGKKPQG